MPKERVGNVEVRWSRDDVDEMIHVRVYGYKDYDLGFGENGFPIIPERFEEEVKQKYLLNLNFVKDLVRVLQKAVRQIENPGPTVTIEPEGLKLLMDALNLSLAPFDEESLAKRIAELANKGTRLLGAGDDV